MKQSEFRRWIMELWLTNKEEHLTWGQEPYTINEYWTKHKWWCRSEWRKKYGPLKLRKMAVE